MKNIYIFIICFTGIVGTAPAKEKSKTAEKNVSLSTRTEGTMVTSNGTSIEILNLEFANAKKNGVIIEPYGNPLTGKYMRYIIPKMEYKNASLDEVQLYVKMFDPKGRLMSNSSSPEGYTYYVLLSVLGKSDIKTAQLGKWKGPFMRGEYRFEVYFERKKIYSTTVMMKGRIVYVPSIDRCYCDMCNTRQGKRRLSASESRRIYIATGGQKELHINRVGIIADWRMVER